MAIPLGPFGHSGHQSTRVLFGAAALSSVTQDVADRALEVLLKHGINHIDVAASYGDALSEAALVNSLGVEAHTRRTICSASSFLEKSSTVAASSTLSSMAP